MRELEGCRSKCRLLWAVRQGGTLRQRGGPGGMGVAPATGDQVTRSLPTRARAQPHWVLRADLRLIPAITS